MREGKVLVCDPTILNNRLSSSFVLRCLNSDKVRNGYLKRYINTHMLILLESTKKHCNKSIASQKISLTTRLNWTSEKIQETFHSMKVFLVGICRNLY